jgi:alpha-beta hydrolase superfamily lysophospholipase
MTDPLETELDGSEGKLFVAAWPNPDARYIALIVHGYAEHIGRYAHVAERLVADGAAVYGPDHLGHGRSDGERALITNGEHLTADLDLVAELARSEHPGLPLVVVGHSMGGLIAARYAQAHRGELAALVLSGPVIGANPAFQALLELDPMPEIPIDPAVLSRDPAVGEAYLADPLVYNGPFKRETLRALFAAVAAVAAEPGLASLPVLWIHGEEDALAPLGPTAEAFEHLRGDASEQKIYPEARHEIFNETNQDEVLDDVVAFIDRALDSPR